MTRYHDENMEWFRNLKPVRNEEIIKPKRNIFFEISLAIDQRIGDRSQDQKKFDSHRS